MSGPAMAQGAGGWGAFGQPQRGAPKKGLLPPVWGGAQYGTSGGAYDPSTPFGQTAGANYTTPGGRPVRAVTGTRSAMMEVPAVTAPKGTQEFREQVAAEQEAIRYNQEQGYSLTDQGFKNKKDEGQSIFAGQQFAEEYGDLDPAYRYDFASGRRQRWFSPERIERRKQRGEASPEGEWEDIPAEDLARLKEYRQFKNSDLGREAGQRFGGAKNPGGTYQGFLMREAQNPLLAHGHWERDPRTGGFMAVRGAGDVAELYDKWGLPINPDGSPAVSAAGMPPPQRGGRMAPGPSMMAPGQPSNRGVVQPGQFQMLGAPAAPAGPQGVAGTGVRAAASSAGFAGRPGALPPALQIPLSRNVMEPEGGGVARPRQFPQGGGETVSGGPAGAGGPLGGGGSWQSQFGSLNIPAASHGFDASQFANINRGDYDFYAQRSPQEQRAIQGVSDLARLISGQGQGLYNVGMPAYTSAMNYIGAIMGGDKAAAMRAIGPQAGQMAELMSGAQRGIEASGLRGGAREQALADLQRQGSGQIANLIPTAQQAALGTAVSGGLQGAQMGLGAEQASAGLGMGIAGMEQENRARAAALEQANRFGAGQLAATEGGLDLQARGMDIQALMGQRELDLREMLGMAGLDLQRELGRSGLDLQRQQLAMQQRQMEQERKARQGQKWGGLLGTALNFVPFGGAAKSLFGGGGGGQRTSAPQAPYYIASPNVVPNLPYF